MRPRRLLGASGRPLNFTVRCRIFATAVALSAAVHSRFACCGISHDTPLLELVGRFGALTGRVGIACPHCSIRLRIVQTRIRLFLVASFAVFFVLVAYLGIWMRAHQVTINKWAGFLGLALAYVGLQLLQRTLIPHLAQVRPAGPDEPLGFPLSSAYDGASESLLDAADSASNNRWRGP